MEAQITAGMKTPVLSSRVGPEGSAGDKGRKRESEALNTERNEQVCCVCCAGKKNHFVLSPSREKDCQFLSFSFISFSHKGGGGHSTVFWETLLKLTVPKKAAKTRRLLSHSDPCPPLPALCLILLVPLWPPHTGPIGGPCPRTGLARKPV